MEYSNKFSKLSKVIAGNTGKKYSKSILKSIVKKAEDAGGLDGAAIYVASLSDYNDGRLRGKWFELSNYTSVDELYADINSMLKSFGPDREEWAIHDFQGFPKSLYSESMGREQLQMAIDFASAADSIQAPIEVFSKWMESEQYNNDFTDITDAVNKFNESYIGEYENKTDYAYDAASEYASSLSESSGYMSEQDKKRQQQSLSNFAGYLEIDDTAAREAAINLTNDDEIEDEDAHYQQIEELERRISDDPVTYFTEEMGYSMEQLIKSAFGGGFPYMSFDSEKYWRDMTFEGYDDIYYNGKYYLFSPV